ncbi:MAG: S41 family peptidase [Cyanobacteria bacterium]|nr:S41 family peptidase [Cyanobacteriota bacterium]MDW8202264.1 S41 family peptidase [Cyanobacteriota bacterium SKYGB_h_bin112]
MGKRVLSWILTIILGWSLWLGWAMPSYALTDEQRLLNEVWRLINRTYLDGTFNHQDWSWVRQRYFPKASDDRAQTYQAIQQMLATLGDPFTRFLPPEQYRSLQTSTSGELTGVGLQIALDDATQQLVVIAPIAGSPADRAGIHPADQIIEIDGISTAHLSLDEAAARMRGAVGSRVELTIVRDGKQQRFSLVRDRIELNPVVAELHTVPSPNKPNQVENIGYIRLSQFNANATVELAKAIKQLEGKGAKGYILDLRNNPGGLLQAGIEIARLWLDQGTIVYTVNRQGVQDSFEATGEALTDDPLIVLVNQGTASASEILAGALQDNNRAQLVGERTFGKGLIQSLFELSDGSGLAVTVAKYETPSHHDIHRQGIQPDYVVALEPLAIEQIGTAADSQYQLAENLLISQVVLTGAT